MQVISPKWGGECKMSQKEMDLRYLVELEGAGRLGELDVDGIAGGRRVEIVRHVQRVYRVARAAQRAGYPTVVVLGNQMMEEFISLHNIVGESLNVHGDIDGYHLVQHDIASASYALGRVETGISLNTGIVQYYVDLCDGDVSELSDDAFFVYTKAVAGLVENNEEFRNEFGVDKWGQFVMGMAERQYPDYPGRALRLARHYATNDDLQGAIDLLTYAVSDEVRTYGKHDQVVDCEAELKRLLA